MVKISYRTNVVTFLNGNRARQFTEEQYIYKTFFFFNMNNKKAMKGTQ